MIAESDAAVDALEAAWKPAQIHKQGAVPENPQTPYIVVSASSGQPGNLRLSAVHGSRGYRIAMQAFGRTSDEVGRAVEAAEGTFVDKRLVVAGYETTPCQAEIATVIRDPDAGSLLGCFLTFTFNAFPMEDA